jgi:hypothetical protein
MTQPQHGNEFLEWVYSRGPAAKEDQTGGAKKKKIRMVLLV